MCVNRHDEILSFAPVPYWTLHATVDLEGESISVSGNRGRIFKKDTAIAIQKSLKDCKVGTIQSVTKTKKQLQRPAALNTVEMLRAASAGLGISPHEAVRD